MKKLFLIIILALAFFLLSFKIDRAFCGHHDWNGVVYGNIARNYLRYGFLKTKFGEVTDYGTVASQDFHYHTNHPVLFPILLAIFFKFFGISEWSARIFAILFSISSLYIFDLIAKRIYRLNYSYFYILLGIFTPLFLYYGKMPVYEPVISLFILLTIYFYFIWRKNQENKYFFLICLNLFLAQMVEWPGFYLSFILFLHYLLFPSRKKSRFFGLWWLGLALFSFLLIVFHQYILTGEWHGNLARILTFRLGGGKAGQPFTFWQFIRLELARSRVFLTSPLLFLTFLWVIGYILTLIRKKRISSQKHFVFLFLLFGALHIIIFPNVAWYHDYMLYYLFFPVLLVSSLILEKIFDFLRRYKLIFYIPLLTLVFFEKRRFFNDLTKAGPHCHCVIIGKQVKQGFKEPIVLVENIEDYKDCSPFTNFYADKEVIFKQKDKN